MSKLSKLSKMRSKDLILLDQDWIKHSKAVARGQLQQLYRIESALFNTKYSNLIDLWIVSYYGKLVQVELNSGIYEILVYDETEYYLRFVSNNENTSTDLHP